MKKIFKLKEKESIIKNLIKENEEVMCEISDINDLNSEKLNNFYNLTRYQLISYVEYSYDDKNFVEEYWGDYVKLSKLPLLKLFEAVFILRVGELTN